MSLPAANCQHATTVEPITFAARIAQSAFPPETMPSLSFQLASAMSQLGSFLRIRGEEGLEHYHAIALALACLEPLANDIRTYQALLLTLLTYDRRSANLPRIVPAAQFRVQKNHTIHFIQLLGDQTAFQPLYAEARQIDTYGARNLSHRKVERIMLLARELGGRSLLAPVSATEEILMSLRDLPSPAR